VDRWDTPCGISMYWIHTPSVSHGLRWILAFTRYSFTSKLLCTSQSFMCPPPRCIANTIAILLHDHCAMYDPLPTHLLYAIHHTQLVLAISCEGQAGSRGLPRSPLYLATSRLLIRTPGLAERHARTGLFGYAVTNGVRAAFTHTQYAVRTSIFLIRVLF